MLSILLTWAVVSVMASPVLGAFLRLGRRPGGFLV
jgi:hypothetical protein